MVKIKIGETEREFATQEQADAALRQHEQAVRVQKIALGLYHAINGGKDHRTEATGLAVYRVVATDVCSSLKGKDRTAGEIQRILSGMSADDVQEVIDAFNSVRESLAFLIDAPNTPLPGGVQSRTLATMVQQFVCPESKSASKDALLGTLANVYNATKAATNVAAQAREAIA